MNADLTLWGLFLSSLLSSTLLPGGSEILLATLVTRTSHDPLMLLLIATAGNTLGGMITWGMGYALKWWYPISNLSRQLNAQAVDRIQKWGSPVLLGSWMPVLGDPLCFAAGWVGVHGLSALAWIGLGKAGRYAFLIWAVS